MPATHAIEPATDGTVAAELVNNGFAVFQNVLTQQQVADLRTALQEHFARAGEYAYGGLTQPRGMQAIRKVAEVVLAEPMLDMMRQCAYPHAPVLTGECFLAVNTLARWHKDVTKGMRLGNDIYSDPEFRVYKIGIYLQDQPEDATEVLKVVPGSHMNPEYTCTPAKPLAIRTGDVVVFDVRIDHAGQMPTVAQRMAHRLAKGVGPWTRTDPDALFAKGRRTFGRRKNDRMGVFLTFGPAAASAAFEAGLALHDPAALGIDSGNPQALDAGIRQMLAERHIGLIRP